MVRHDPLTRALVQLWCEQLRQRRLERGITLAEMERRLGYTRLMIRQWENGVHIPRLDGLVRWAEELDFDLQMVDNQVIEEDREEE
jgi:transcriptional regulator with XRE-family HTH domain